MNHHPVWSAAGSVMMGTGEMEYMFKKTLTPSDVGKLDRFVIPKKHAKRYFRIGGGSGASDSDVDSEILLSFVDECGMCWKFRYSYGSSTRSSVLKKGWSLYVKEKVLEAGDLVMFSRLKADNNRIFIGFRRIMEPPIAQPPVILANGVRGPRMTYFAPSPAYHVPGTHPNQPQYCPYHGAIVLRGSTPTNGNKSKKIRLFGVNIEQPDPLQNDTKCRVEKQG